MIHAFATLVTATIFMTTQLIFDFQQSSDASRWRVVDDVVMGGVSNGSISVNEEGHGVFSGSVSTDNNGGFSSIRSQVSGIEITDQRTVQLHIKGDGKEYQFRLKANSRDYFSYIHSFSTSGAWETIELNLSDFYPSYRGRKLNQPNFNSRTFEEIAFLIANGRDEEFELVIDKIELR